MAIPADSEAMNDHSTERRGGWLMIMLGWALAFFVITGFYLMLQKNTEQARRGTVIVANGANGSELVLTKNQAGHYLAEGSINSRDVVFLVDTGATRVAVSESVADRVGLVKKQTRRIQSAAGIVSAWETDIPELKVGFILFRDLSGVIIPDLEQETVLLGMNALEKLHITQSGGQLHLRPPPLNQPE